MIRVLHSVSSMDRAGIETMLMNYYRHIDRRRVQFDFLANKPSCGAYEPEIRQLGGRVFHLPGFGRPAAQLSAMRRVFREHPEYTIVEGHNGMLMAFALGAAKAAGIPVRIAHAHATAIPVDVHTKLKRPLRPLVGALATDHWACGDTAGAFYFSRWAQGERIIVRNAIERERFAYDPAARLRLRERLGLCGCLVVGHVGRMSREKNHERLLSFFGQILCAEPRARLVLVGDGALRSALAEQARPLGDAVIFAGEQADTAPWYSLFDVLVMPSLTEGFPVVGVEAQSSGLPCLFSAGIPQETRLTPNVRFLSLGESDARWACEALALGRMPRETQPITGYDIAEEAPRLERLYLSLAEKARRGKR